MCVWVTHITNSSCRISDISLDNNQVRKYGIQASSDSTTSAFSYCAISALQRHACHSRRCLPCLGFQRFGQYIRIQGLCREQLASLRRLLSRLGNQTTYTLTGLPDGSWYFAVTAYDINGNESDFSNEVSQTIGTVADTTPPVISGLTSASITTAGATIVWTTNEASTSQVEYGTSTSYGNIALKSSLDLSHSQTLSGLLAGTLYHYRVKSIDAAGNVAVSSDGTFTTTVPVDTTPPVISSVADSNVTSTAATIAWTTNEAANTRVDYGTTTSYDSFAFNGTMATSHSQALSGLTASTLYHYRVRSTDAAGNAAVSGDYTFTTPAPPDTTAPVISSVSSSNLTSSGATIAWTTNEAASTQVEYGTTTGYGTSSALNSSMVTSHTQALSGLVGQYAVSLSREIRRCGGQCGGFRRLYVHDAGSAGHDRAGYQQREQCKSHQHRSNHCLDHQ